MGAGLAAGLAGILAACQGSLPIPTPEGQGPVRRPEPLPPATPPSAPQIRLDVDFGRTVRLEGVSVEQEALRPGQFLRIWFHWLANDVSQEDLRSLGQIVGPYGRVMGKEDDQIGPRKNYLSRWRRGDRSVDEMRIRIPPSTPPGEYGLVVAVLRPDNQTHVPITSEASRLTLWGEDALLVTTIEVRLS
ncbi:MAG TPA: hypothetical protein VEQ11_15980 [Chloroflexota bacterium]|nr:hypothetical protein [Chloroflexota bacterium]